jgi:hypothetical protein
VHFTRIAEYALAHLLISKIVDVALLVRWKEQSGREMMASQIFLYQHDS